MITGMWKSGHLAYFLRVMNGSPFFKVVPSGIEEVTWGTWSLFLAQTGTYLPSMFSEMYILPSVSLLNCYFRMPILKEKKCYWGPSGLYMCLNVRLLLVLKMPVRRWGNLLISLLLKPLCKSHLILKAAATDLEWSFSLVSLASLHKEGQFQISPWEPSRNWALNQWGLKHSTFTEERSGRILSEMVCPSLSFSICTVKDTHKKLGISPTSKLSKRFSISFSFSFSCYFLEIMFGTNKIWIKDTLLY